MTPGLDPHQQPPQPGPRHAMIRGNLLRLLATQIGDRPWVATEDGPALQLDGAPFYPDALLIRTPPPGATAVDDALLVADIQAPGHRDADFHRTLLYYQLAPSLQAFVLLSQWEPKALLHEKQGANWFINSLSGFGATVVSPTLGLRLPLAEIYRGVF